ncbi:AAA family ATPase [Chondromyces apiculatus]|uniref:ATP binding protein n=1 Tax=Chondromyces apiculatus DSM 436 TaxID=1192034 RepID=A0A017T8H8_9BACT|nr:AAA family ATPase [Chondromyces apiculatus]EYF05110.1 ATP binding protein [Chondromyces apiculatus DSM 436]
MATKKADESGERRRVGRALPATKSTRRVARNDRTRERSKPSEDVTAIYVLKLTVENVRCFGPAQTLDLSDGHGKPKQWTVILGNNGVGKTTLLQALAASLPKEDKAFSPKEGDAVFSPALCVDLHQRAPQFMRASEEMTSLRIALALGGPLAAAASTFEEDSTEISIEADGLVGFTSRDVALRGLHCIGYGANRSMGSGSLLGRDTDDHVATLFNEGAVLRNAEEWLLQADYAASKPSKEQARARDRRDAVKSMLIALLPDVEDLQLLADIGSNPARPQPGIRLKTPYGWVPLQALSMGYKTLLAWMVDLASRLYERYPDRDNPLSGPAVVLVDEIDLHLHPAWQRTLLDYLSQRFPNVQFIVTAHSPLVVQAATDANIVVLRREGDHVVIDNGASAVRNWRVDQILTSDLFGLPSARSPALDPLLAERRRLLTKPRLSAADERALARIERDIGQLPTGETPEQMEAMDIIQRAASALRRTGGGAR